MFDVTLLLYGGLNQVIFLFLCFDLFLEVCILFFFYNRYFFTGLSYTCFCFVFLLQMSMLEELLDSL